MSKSVKGTRTEQNLLKAFAGESQARTRYTFFASVAKKEGYEQIAGVFTETADQEKEHAKRFFKFLEGGMVEITAAYPAGVIGTTAENLAAAAANRHYGRKPAGGSQRGERGVGRALSRLRQSSRRGGFPRNRQCVQADFQSRGGA